MKHLSEGDLHGWLDGEVSADEQEPIRRHLASCAECSARLERARRLREEARALLDSAVPGGGRPPFEGIERRAGRSVAGAGTRSGEPVGGRRWSSVQRLGWAATVVLALGAGWMGRALLVERGWTDPFHEGPRSEIAPQMEARQEVEPKAALEEAREKADRDEEQSDTPGTGEETGEGAARGGRDDVEANRAAPPGVAENLAARPADALRARSPVEGEGSQGWHDEPRLLPPPLPAGASGCYRLEFSWSPGVGYLPGDLELTDRPVVDRPGTTARLVSTPGGAVAKLGEAIWGALSADSLWVRLSTEPEQETLTLRLERVGSDWVGEGRVRDPTGRAGEDRGRVTLVRIPCDGR